MSDVNGLIEKAVEKGGFVRERYVHDNVPTDPSRISVFPFFGDLRSLFVLKCKCKWFKKSDGTSKDLEDLVEFKPCSNCGGPRKFKCPNCGNIVKMMRFNVIE